MNKYSFAHARVGDFAGNDIGSLLEELAHLRGVPVHGLVIHVLVHALHPHEDKRRIPLSKSEFKMEYFLPMRLKKLLDSDVYWLCNDLVRISGKGHIEDYHGLALFTFLNRMIVKDQKQKNVNKRRRYGR